MQNRPRSKARYFGMTAIQLATIACFGLVLLVSMTTVVWFISNDLKAAPAAQGTPDASAMAPLDTAQPSLTPEAVPTATEIPTETAIPYEALIPEGWEQMSNEQLEFWVPPSFKGGDFRNDLNGSADRIAAADPLFAEFAEGLKQDPPAFWFWLMDTAVSPNGYQAGIGLDFEDASGWSLDAYADEVISNFTSDVIVLKRRDFEMNSYQALRLEIEGTDVSFRYQEAIYLIQDGDRIWYFVCSSHLNEFFDYQSHFDEVVRTFRTLP
jgi:hypothetical protein